MMTWSSRRRSPEFTGVVDPADINRLEDASLKSLLLATLDNGFKIETAEGSFFPVIDYGYYQKYQSAVTADCVAYLEIMRLESERMPAKDAALMIGWEEILARRNVKNSLLRHIALHRISLRYNCYCKST